MSNLNQSERVLVSLYAFGQLNSDKEEVFDGNQGRFLNFDTSLLPNSKRGITSRDLINGTSFCFYISLA